MQQYNNLSIYVCIDDKLRTCPKKKKKHLHIIRKKINLWIVLFCSQTLLAAAHENL